MATSFNFKICTPAMESFSGPVTEVILPALDGESGVMAGHKNFIGLLGTGVLKLVTEGDDYWYMVSSGVYEVSGGVLTILAEVAEVAGEIQVEPAREKVKELEPRISSTSSYANEYSELKVEFDRANARVEAYRRTHLVN